MRALNGQESRTACQLLKAAGAAFPRSPRPTATDSSYGLETLRDLFQRPSRRSVTARLTVRPPRPAAPLGFLRRRSPRPWSGLLPDGHASRQDLKPRTP